MRWIRNKYESEETRSLKFFAAFFFVMAFLRRKGK